MWNVFEESKEETCTVSKSRDRNRWGEMKEIEQRVYEEESVLLITLRSLCWRIWRERSTLWKRLIQWNLTSLEESNAVDLENMKEQNVFDHISGVRLDPELLSASKDEIEFMKSLEDDRKVGQRTRIFMSSSRKEKTRTKDMSSDQSISRDYVEKISNAGIRRYQECLHQWHRSNTWCSYPSKRWCGISEQVFQSCRERKIRSLTRRVFQIIRTFQMSSLGVTKNRVSLDVPYSIHSIISTVQADQNEDARDDWSCKLWTC